MMSALKGTTNLCRVLAPGEFHTSIASRFTLDDETPLFILASVPDDYCFTGRALVHLDGCGPVGKKRSARRYAWKDFLVTGVVLDTAGVADADCEIKFALRARDGSDRREYCIDVRKDQTATVTWLYKALLTISEAQAEGARADARLRLALSTTLATGVVAASGADPVVTFRAFAAEIAAAERDNVPGDFGSVFARYAQFAGLPGAPPPGPPPAKGRE